MPTSKHAVGERRSCTECSAHLGRSVGADKRVHRPIRLLIFGCRGRVQRLVHTQPCSESSHHRTPQRHTSQQPPSLVTTPAPCHTQPHTLHLHQPRRLSVAPLPAHPISKSSWATPPLVTSARCSRRPTTMGTTPAPRTSAPVRHWDECDPCISGLLDSAFNSPLQKLHVLDGSDAAPNWRPCHIAKDISVFRVLLELSHTARA